MRSVARRQRPPAPPPSPAPVSQAKPERSPRFLHFWTLVYVTVIYVRPSEIIASLANVRILDFLSIGGAVVLAVSLALNPRKFWDQPHDRWLLLYLLMIVISNPLHGWFGGAQVAFTDFAPVLFCYVLIRCAVRTVPQMRLFSRVLIVLNIFLATNGLLQVFAGAGFGNVEAMETHEGMRIQGTGIFNDPNDLGMTLVMIVPFLLSSGFTKGTRWPIRFLSIVSLGALLTACYYTNSRGTILGLGMVFGAYAYRRFGFLTASVFAGIGLIGLLALGPSRMSTVSADEESAQGRIQAWAAGYEMLKSSPIWGVGFRQFGELHDRVAHNAFVHVLAELGVIGATAFVAMFYWYFISFRQSKANPPDPSTLRLRQDFADAGLGLLTCMCFLSRQYIVVPFILIGLSASFRGMIGDVASPDEQPLTHVTAILAITGTLIVVFYIIARLFASY